MKTIEDLRLEKTISDMILEVAELFNDVTTSDLQGIAGAKAMRIIEMVKNGERV